MKRLAAIRKAANWRERLALAQNKEPGTKFDDVFKRAETALKFIDKKIGVEGEAWLAEIGRYFAIIFQQKDGGQMLHELADALNKWQRHKPNLSLADHIRCELIALNGMFPPGKPRLKIVNNKIEQGEPYSPVRTREVIDNLIRKKIIKENTPEICRQIRREANKLNIPLDHTPGRPQGAKTRTKHT